MTALGLISSHSHLDFRSLMKNGRGCDLFNSNSYTKSYTQECSQHKVNWGEIFYARLGCPHTVPKGDILGAVGGVYICSPASSGDNALTTTTISRSEVSDYSFI